MIDVNAENLIIFNCIISFVAIMASAIALPNFIMIIGVGLLMFVSFSSGIWFMSYYSRSRSR